MPRWSNKLSAFEHIRTKPVKPNTLESSRIRSSRAEYARVEPNTLASRRVSRKRGVARSVYFEQPLIASLVQRTAQCLCSFFITYGHFNPQPWVLVKAEVILPERKRTKS